MPNKYERDYYWSTMFWNIDIKSSFSSMLEVLFTSTKTWIPIAKAVWKS